MLFGMDMNLPDIPGVAARPFGRDGDYQIVSDLVVAEARADGQEDAVSTAEEVEVAFRNAENMDLEKDFRFVEINGEPVAYVTTRWWDEVDGPRVYRHMCKVLPQFRNQGIGTALLEWAQRRLTERAEHHDTERTRVYRTDVDEQALGGAALLEADGYQPIQHGALLIRPNLNDIPDVQLPEGLEIRPVSAERVAQDLRRRRRGIS